MMSSQRVPWWLQAVVLIKAKSILENEIRIGVHRVQRACQKPKAVFIPVYVP